MTFVTPTLVQSCFWQMAFCHFVTWEKMALRPSVWMNSVQITFGPLTKKGSVASVKSNFWTNVILSFCHLRTKWRCDILFGWIFSKSHIILWPYNGLWLMLQCHFVILSLENKMALRLSVGVNFLQITFSPFTIKWFRHFYLIKFLAKCHFDILSLESKITLRLSVGMNFLQITFGPLTI